MAAQSAGGRKVMVARGSGPGCGEAIAANWELADCRGAWQGKPRLGNGGEAGKKMMSV
ncbi:hypothetical protein SESBI_34367 [Sesbania bispinosa]|nr:hypothetical protein SESBI_34367 [Sesbania bispinosa]